MKMFQIDPINLCWQSDFIMDNLKEPKSGALEAKSWK